MKKKMVALGALLVPAASFADVVIPPVPDSVNNAITQLEGAATNYAAVILP